jgi:sulfatase maturation enzyme AslB (radical SAM superfamily)
MKLEDIGFYTLSDERAENASNTSDLWRCEILLTDKCNFNCVYCRGMREDFSGELSLSDSRKVVEYWVSQKLHNIRFSGGEPTLYKGLVDLVKIAKEGGVERIALSTNGSADKSLYDELIDAGVNDFSISLDGACCSVGDKMAGKKKSWNTVIENIRYISDKTYVTAGMVFTEENLDECVEAVMFANSLGVSDIRVIPSAQYNKALKKLANLNEDVLAKYPILKYRVKNIQKEKHVRGIKKTDCNKCWLGLDDMAVAGGYHFPCIIYLREGGDPIGKVDENTRNDRLNWVLNHDTKKDAICVKNCLDVCVEYNNKANKAHEC